ncbi:tRNA threonylcarbamoyl adenosine modification protein, Sua5/YciO/YrdC/YwlC family [Actinomadura madurae]|uniref:L-threonylcarbamoyladenylate synthase n=1 Tax=Actinomadura madurae TaxID=1993 RepID=A0A1I5XDF8_9ACTN|nr:tRNA threonylcarbamoyl adenosine modification protein, Sua5/YciO/YrdC/YwlC family [Actinomadura madurae]
MAGVSRRYDCTEPMERTRGIAEAVSAVRRGELVVLPTDTVYGVGADAFVPPAVTALLDAKGRGREMPPPVLVGSVRAAAALVEDLGTYGQDLIDEFWPGALTLVCRANTNLMWDLGETKGTVAVRMPMHELAVELLKETGPLAVSSANLSGQPAARTADEAEKMLGDSVSVYLDGGTSGHADPSTIIDLTGPVPRLLRVGAIPADKIRSVVGVLLTDEDEQDEKTEPDEPAEQDVRGEAGEPADVSSAPREGGPSLSKREPAQAPDGAAEAPATGAERTGEADETSSATGPSLSKPAEQTPVEQTSAEQAAPAQSTPEQAAAEQTAPEQTAPEPSTSRQTPAEQSTPEQAAAEQAAAEQTAAAQTAAAQSTPAQSTPAQSTPAQSTREQAATEEPDPEKQ